MDVWFRRLTESRALSLLETKRHVPGTARVRPAVRVPRAFRTILLAFACVLLVLSVRPQGLQHKTGVINVEVPIRVFDGDRFVDDLALGDFEIFENGKPQQAVALYRVQKTNIQKEEAAVPANVKPAPKTKRTIVMEFEVLDPLPKIDDAIDYFFNEVLQPEDTLQVVTPKKTYHFKPEALARLPRPVIAGQLKGKLRADILAAAAEYKRLLDDVRDVMKMPIPDPDQKLMMISDLLRELRDRVKIDRAALKRLAQTLKGMEGQKYVFLFYERELIEDPTASFGNFGLEAASVSELSDMAAADVQRITEVTAKDVEQIFSDASITAHFIYLTQSRKNAAGLDAEKQAGGGDLRGVKDLSPMIFTAFREMAEATGGITDSSGNPFAGFQKAVTATENYYILYYVPAEYRADGKFREIEVSVKGKSYRITHRAGYFAN